MDDCKLLEGFFIVLFLGGRCVREFLFDFFLGEGEMHIYCLCCDN